MGLENGIVLQVRGKIDPDAAILKVPGIEKVDWYDNPEPGFTYYDICYWRKYWNIREILFDNCHTKESNHAYPLTIKQLESIRDDIYCLICDGEAGWDTSRTMWSFEDSVGRLGWDIVRISELIRYLKTDTGYCEAFFYDSY